MRKFNDIDFLIGIRVTIFSFRHRFHYKNYHIAQTGTFVRRFFLFQISLGRLREKRMTIKFIYLHYNEHFIARQFYKENARHTFY